METNISNKCKAYTSLEQSKHLAEILPHKSADGTWEKVSICGAKVDIPEDMQYRHKEIPFSFFSGIGVPCWSLAALLDVISYPTLSQEYDGKWSCREYQEGEEVEGYDNPVDACYELIIQLHEQKLL